MTALTSWYPVLKIFTRNPVWACWNSWGPFFPQNFNYPHCLVSILLGHLEFSEKHPKVFIISLCVSLKDFNLIKLISSCGLHLLQGLLFKTNRQKILVTQTSVDLRRVLKTPRELCAGLHSRHMTTRAFHQHPPQFLSAAKLLMAFYAQDCQIVSTLNCSIVLSIYQPKHLQEFKPFKLPSDTELQYFRVALNNLKKGGGEKNLSSEAHPLTQIAVARRCGSNAAICDSEDAFYLEQPKATKSFIVPIISAVTISTANRRIILIQQWFPPPPPPPQGLPSQGHPFQINICRWGKKNQGLGTSYLTLGKAIIILLTNLGRMRS